MSTKKFIVTLDGPGMEHFGADDFERVLKDYAFETEVVVVDADKPPCTGCDFETTREGDSCYMFSDCGLCQDRPRTGTKLI